MRQSLRSHAAREQCIARPDLAREQLLRAAARQVVRSDVQHWWLPPARQGGRTHIPDDRLWLAYATAHHVERVDRQITPEPRRR